MGDTWHKAAPHLIAVSDVGGNERQQLYLISNYGVNNVESSAPIGRCFQHDIRRLTVDDEAIHRFGAWSANGEAIIYTSNARNGVDFDLYWMNVESGEAGWLPRPREIGRRSPGRPMARQF